MPLKGPVCAKGRTLKLKKKKRHQPAPRSETLRLEPPSRPPERSATASSYRHWNFRPVVHTRADADTPGIERRRVYIVGEQHATSDWHWFPSAQQHASGINAITPASRSVLQPTERCRARSGADAEQRGGTPERDKRRLPRRPHASLTVMKHSSKLTAPRLYSVT